MKTRVRRERVLVGSVRPQPRRIQRAPIETKVASPRHHRWLRLAPWIFVAGACVFGLVTLAGELAPVQPVNDETFHYEMVRWAVQQIHQGNVLPLDGWFPYLSLGDAQFSRARAAHIDCRER